MAYKNGRFVWFELVTPNADDGIAFWSEVGPLSVSEMDMGKGPYRMLAGAGGTVGGVTAPQMAGVPAHWTSYLSVDDVAARVEAVTRAGGKLIVPPTDIGIGTFALVADPQGATFNLWRGAESDDNGAVGVNWTELWTPNADQAAAFYARVIGLGHETMQMPQGAYHLLKLGSDSVAGAMSMPDPAIPPMWVPYLQVDDVDAAAERARRLGGQVYAEPMSMEGIGRFAVIADRQGAAAGLIRPAAR